MSTHEIDIEPIIAYIEEGIAVDGEEHPGWNALAELVKDAVDAHIEEFGSFDIDNDDHFDAVVSWVDAQI